jgi:hypothetical protein
MSTEEQKAAANAERATIKVEVIKADKVEETAPIEAKEETAEETETTEAEEDKEEKEESVEASEKTEEDLEAEKLEAKSAAEKAKIQKRIDKEVAKRKVLEKEVDDLKKIIAAKSSEDGNKYTEEEVEKKAEEKAIAKFLERQFVDACNSLAAAAKKLDKDFDKKIAQLAEDVAPLPAYMITTLNDQDNGGAILNYFIENPDEYEELIMLESNRMSSRIGKLSSKLEKIEAEKPKEKPKPASKVPPPVTPVGGKGGTSNALLTEADTKNMAEFVKKRAAMVDQRRKSGHYNAR